MKEYISASDLAIWLVLIAGQVILCVCGLTKRLFSRLPCFTLYILCSALQSFILLAIAFAAPYSTYYQTFYVTGHIVSLLAFGTLLEFGKQVLPGLNLPQREKALTCLLAAMGVTIAFVWLWPLRSIANEKRFEVAACLAIAIAFMFVAGYSRYLGLRWSRLVGGVALTLGLVYLVNGLTKALIGHYPSTSVLTIRQARAIANVMAVCAWIVVVVSPWGEYELTEDVLEKAETILNGAETSLRRFATGGSM